VLSRCVFLFGKKRNIEKRILEQAKALRDMIELTGDKQLNTQAVREALRKVAEDVSKLSDIERDRLARRVDEIFEEKIAILRGWRESNVRKIKSMLKELRLSKKIPQAKFNRVKMLDSQIKLYDAQLMVLENLRDILVDTIQRGVDPVTAWNRVMRSSTVISEFVETLAEHAEAYEELMGEGVSERELEELEEEYGVKEPEEVSRKELKKLMEKYGVEE